MATRSWFLNGAKNLSGISFRNATPASSNPDNPSDAYFERFISTIDDAARLTAKTVMFGQVDDPNNTGIFIQKDEIVLKTQGKESLCITPVLATIATQLDIEGFELRLNTKNTLGSGEFTGFSLEREVGVKEPYAIRWEEDELKVGVGLISDLQFISRNSKMDLVDQSFGFYDTTKDVTVYTADLLYDEGLNTVVSTNQIVKTSLGVEPKLMTLNYTQNLGAGENIDLIFNRQADSLNQARVRFEGDLQHFRVSNFTQDAGGLVTSELTKQDNPVDTCVPFHSDADDELKFDEDLTYTSGNQRLTAENIRVNNFQGLEGRNFDDEFRRYLVDPYNRTNIAPGSVLAITFVNPFSPENFEYAWVNTFPASSDRTNRTRPSGTDGGGGGGGDPWDPKGPGGPGGGGSAPPSTIDPDDPFPDPDNPTTPPDLPPDAPIPPVLIPPPLGGNANFIDPADQVVNDYCNDFVRRESIKQFTRFIKLRDTPEDYIGFGNYLVKVALGEDGVEFTDVIELDDGTLINPAITFKNSTNNTGISLFGTTGITFTDNATNFLEVDPVNAKYEGSDWQFINNVGVQKFLTIGNTGAGTHYILPDNRPSPETSDYILVYQANTNTVDWELKTGVAPTFISLSDTPVDYTGSTNQTLVSTGSGLVFNGQILNNPGNFVQLRLLGSDRLDINSSNTLLRASDDDIRINLQATQTRLTLGGEDRIVLASTVNSLEFGGFPRISIGSTNTLLRDLVGVIKLGIDNTSVAIYDGTLLYRLPTTSGTVGQVLTKGSGNVTTWETPATGITEVLTFGGGGSGDVATLTITDGLITSRTLNP